MTPHDRRLRWMLAALLALTVFAVYGRVVGHEFVYDDAFYVAQNAVVQRGLSLDGLKWAFTDVDTNWHPLTWLSHMLDVTLFGTSSGAPHAINVLWHAANSVLLLFVLSSATGALLPSAMVAALFALHPTHVESVAWVAERKDVLSAFFGLATLGVYVSWTRAKSSARHVSMLALFALGLMSKPTLVTLPCAMLLFDGWPLARTSLGWRRLVLEKAPLFAMAAAACVVTVVAQRGGRAVAGLELFPFAWRAQNAVWAYFKYLKQFAWPTGLACFYPHPYASLGAANTALAAAVVLALSIGAIARRKRAPFAFTGWFWFLGTLVPMIGLVQVGGQSYADRYSYLSQIGLSIAIVFGASELIRRGQLELRFAASFGIAWLAVLAALAFVQVGVWRNAETLFAHALKVTGDNAVARTGLGLDALAKGRAFDAAEQLRAALAIDPGSAAAHSAFAKALMKLGRIEDAERLCADWSKTHPNDEHNWVALAAARFSFGDVAGALSASEQALRLAPEWAGYWNRYGKDLWIAGRTSDALAALKRACELDPSAPNFAAELRAATALAKDPSDRSPEVLELRSSLAASHREVAHALVVREKFEPARAELEASLALDPRSADAHAELADVFEREHDTPHAVEHWKAALELDPKRPVIHNNLGWAAMLDSKWDDAITHFDAALQLDPHFERARVNRDEALRRRAKQ